MLVATFTNETKNSASFSNETKNTSTFSNMSKSLIAMGDMTLEELSNYTFKSVVLATGTLLEDVTFETLVDIIWTNQAKN